MRWQLVISDLEGRNLGELRNARDRSLFWRLNGIPNLSFRIGSAHPRSDDLLAGDVLIKAYRSRVATDGPGDPWVLQENYDVTSAEEVAEGNATDGIAVIAEGPFQRLGPGGDTPGRLIGKSTAGYTRTGDRGETMVDILAVCNAEAPTGIIPGNTWDSSSDTYGPVHYKAAGEAIAELAAPLDGPDFQVVAVEPTEYDGAVGVLEAAPVLGTLREQLFFEYGAGTRHNTRYFRRPVDRKGLLNRAYALPPGFPEQSAGEVASFENAASQAIRGLREAVISTDIADLQLRQFLCAEHVRIRALPRQTIVFDPHVYDPAQPRRVPQFPVDFDIGDLVRARAVVSGRERFNAWFRLYGVTLGLDNVGRATPQVALLPQGQS